MLISFVLIGKVFAAEIHIVCKILVASGKVCMVSLWWPMRCYEAGKHGKSDVTSSDIGVCHV